MEIQNWRSNGWGYEAKSSPSDIVQSLSRLGTNRVDHRLVWRGQSNARFPVWSSLYRKLYERQNEHPSESVVRQVESNIIAAARSWEVGSELDNDLAILVSLQHHGVPTRLLDVTSDFLTALWFAAQPASRGEATTNNPGGVVFAFDVTGLPNYSSRYRHSGWGDANSLPLSSALATSTADLRPFLVTPASDDPRVITQRSLFLSGAVPDISVNPYVFGLPIEVGEQPKERLKRLMTEPVGVGRHSPIPFCAISFQHQAKAKILQYLENNHNLTAATIYPDMQGFADYGWRKFVQN